MKRIAIIGGGVTGLALAYALARQDQALTVFEKEEKTGGLAAAFEADPYPIDKYYRHIFPHHHELLDVIRDLGLEDRLIFKKASIAYFSRGMIYPLNSAWDMLRFTPLSLPDRLRVGLSASLLLRKREWGAFDGTTAEAYLKTGCGLRGYQIFWEPLLKNKFGDYSSCIAATWLWDRLASRVRGRHAGSSESLGYLEGGFGLLWERMGAEIEKRRGRIMTGHPVASIDQAIDGTGSFVVNGDRDHPYDVCVVSLPLPLFGDVFPTLPADYRAGLAAIDYSHSVCMVMRLKQPLSSHYWINIGDTSIPFTVVVEHTNWMDGQNYGGRHVAYLSRYVQHMDDFAWAAPDQKLFEFYCGFLKKIFKHFHESQVLDFRVFRDRHTQPIFKKHYSRVMPPFATPVKNLFLVDSSQFYPRSRCMNTSFLLAGEFVSFWKGMDTPA